MISSTFFQEMFTGNIQGDFSSGAGSAKQAEQGQSSFSAVLGRAMDDAGGSPNTAASADELSRGHQFLERLKKAIMASGASLEESRVDADALSEFRKLLIKAGFNQQEVEEMISDLTSAGNGKGVSLAALFARASRLSEPDEVGDGSEFLEISALPYIETILGRLGMDEASIRNVLADAKVEGSGIDIAKLAAAIRRAMAAGTLSNENAAGDTDDILDMMRRIGLMENDAQNLAAALDKIISELSRLNKQNGALSEEASGSLLISYLQQLAASLGDKGEELRQLIASAGSGEEGFDGEALLARLVRMREELSAASGEKSRSGEMNLSRFVSALEEQISAGKKIDGMFEKEASGQVTARGIDSFLEKISSDSGVNGRLAASAAEQGYDKDASARDLLQAAEKSAAGANAKNGQGETLLAAARQASAGGNGAENSSGKDEAAKFMDALASAGKQKSRNGAEQNLSAADGFMKAVKSADEVSASAKTGSNRTLPGYLLDQVSRQIVKLRNAGDTDITLQLKPPHLGRMKLNVEHTAGGIKVGIVVESSAAKEMLLSHSNELKAALGDQGLRLDKIDVEAQADFGKSMAQAGREFGGSGGRNGRPAGRGLTGGGMAPEATVASETIRGVDSGRLDLVA